MNMASVLSSLAGCCSVGNVLLGLLFLFLLHQLWEIYEFRGMPPGPRLTSLPFIGNVLSFDQSKQRFPDVVGGLTRKYGPVIAVRLGSQKMVIASSSKAVKEILVTKSADFCGRPQTHSSVNGTLGGKSILQGDYGVAWRLHRKLFSTALRQYLSDIPLLESRVCEQVQKLIQDFEAQDELAFDPADYFMRAVAGVITKITYGEDRDVTEDDLSELLHLNNTLIKNSEDAQDVVVLDFFPIMKYLPMASYRRFFDLKSKIFAVTRRLLKQHEEIHDPSQPSQDLVSSLLQARSKAEYENAEEKAALLSEDHMVNTLEDMFGAGYETTSTALKWVILFLVNYPQYQTEIQKEVDEVVGRVRKPNLADRPKMPFVHAVILETLRLANIVPQLVPHSAMRDTTLLNYRIPKNTVVFADAETIHLNPELWDNPKEFNPNRYLDEDGKLNTSKSNYYPFGAGRRVCVGEALAKVELFLFLTWMLQEFTFVSEDGHDPPGTESIVSFFQYPKPYKIRAMKRE